jgi:hypothetical protein
MLELISENVLPQSLYITNVSFDADHGLIGIGGHGRVLKGKYKKKAVALKMLDNFNKGRKDVSTFSHFIAQNTNYLMGSSFKIFGMKL